MLAEDFIIKGHTANTLSGKCIIEGWEGKHVRISFPSGFRPLVRPCKLITGMVIDYHKEPDNVKAQLEEDGDHRYIAEFYDGHSMAFHNLQDIATYMSQHVYSVKRVYNALGYSSVLHRVRDILN